MKAVIFVGLAALTGCSQSAKPVRYILDQGTAGWVKITYNRSDAPKLPVEDGFVVVRIPQDLKVVTRNRMSPSWDGSEFYYQGRDGKLVRLSSKDDPQRRLWGMEKTSDGDGDREVFFVGEQQQFTHLRGGEMNTGLLDQVRPERRTPTLSDVVSVDATQPK